jgi:hypothetical protein
MEFLGAAGILGKARSIVSSIRGLVQREYSESSSTKGDLSCSEDEIKDLEKTADQPDYTRQHDDKLMIDRRCAMTRDYPPPIPPLAYGNLTARMPYVLTRHYAHGKLILQVERVKHHGYFEARRENGRLILNLLTLDGKCCHGVCEDNEELELEDDLQLVEDKDKEESEEYQETVIDCDYLGRLDGFAIEVVA